VSGATCVAGSGKKVGRTGDTCLANHCNNDSQDAGETSVDCGGECGCRATFEIVTFKNLPSGANFSQFKAMSRDGKRLAGAISRGQGTYPAAFAYDGTVTELESYTKGGSVFAASSDGSVLAGSMSCGNPPSCTDFSSSKITVWSGTTAPKLLVDGTPRGLSSSGTAVAGDYYDGTSQTGFLYNGNSRMPIADMTSVVGVTPDARYVAGNLRTGVQAGLWFAQTQAITKIGATNWSSTTLTGVNGTDPAVIGYGYISSSDSYIGFRWKGSVLTQLGLLAGGVYTSPAGVSADGSTVVGLTGSNSFQQAFIWTDAGKLRTIIDELKARGFEPAVDLQLTNAVFVSDDGKTIVGNLYATPTNSARFWRVVLE
jgi:uncharacterized membrane protein